MAGVAYGKEEKTDVAMRVIADHIRTIAFSITDGQLPSNAKAGYVIRRILRRAVRYAYTFLGQKQAFMYRLVPVLVENMGGAYPELKAQQNLIEKVIKEEEESFLRTPTPRLPERLKSAVWMHLLCMIHSVSHSTLRSLSSAKTDLLPM